MTTWGPPHPDAVLIGHVHVVCKPARLPDATGVAWCEAYQNPDGQRFARRPGKDFYRRGYGGVQYKVLPKSFVPLRKEL